MPHTVLTVFLSSTARDLDPYREAVHRVLSANPFFMVVRMEDFGPQSDAAVPLCCDKARACDLFVGLIGMRRGWEPGGDNQQRSITEMEYDAASDTGRERFICIAPEALPIPGNLHEPDDAFARQQAFRQKLAGTHVAGLRNFSSPDALAAEILNSLTAHIISGKLIYHLRPDLAAGEAKDAAKPVADALEQLADDDDADLLALARNPGGIDIKDLEARLKARAEAVQQDGNRKAAEYWRHIGALAYLHDTPAALAAYRHATDLDPDDADGWNRLGSLYRRIGDLDNAVAAWEHVLALGNRSANQTTIAVATGNLGVVHFTRGDLDRAEQMFTSVLAHYKTTGRKENFAVAHSNLGNVYLTRGDLDHAEEMYAEALALDEAFGNQEGLAGDYGNLGEVYRTREDLDRADEFFGKAIAAYERAGILGEGYAIMHANLGLLEQSRGNIPAACAHWTRARDLFRDLGAPHMVEQVEGLMRDAGCPDA